MAKECKHVNLVVVRVLVLTPRALFAPALSPSEPISARVTAEGALSRVASGDTLWRTYPDRASRAKAGRRMASSQHSRIATSSAAGVPLRLTASDADQVQESPRSAHKNSRGRIAERMKPVVERDVDIARW